MNDLQLHDRLAELADDLAPDADPWAQADGARALHRRQRRTRIGVAGAAIAVALVAVGVPTAVGTLSAPGGGEVAGPSESPDPLRGPAAAVRAALDGWDGSGPAPSRGRSCSFAPEVLTVDSRYEIEPVRQPNGSTATACLWSTDGTGNTPAEARVDLEVSASADLDADQLMELLDADQGCPWTTLFPERTMNVLRVCEADGQQRWELIVLDDDGPGGWSVTAAVGEDLDAGFAVGSMSVANLWGLVVAIDDADEPEITPLNDAFNDLVNQYDARSRAVSMTATAAPMTCPDPPVDLSGGSGAELTELRAPGGSLTCTWATDVGPAAGLSFSVGFDAGRSPVVHRRAEDVSFDAVPGADDAVACFGAVLPSTEPAGGLAACQFPEREEWRLDVADAGGAGMWTITLSAPPGVEVESPIAVMTLIEMADATW